MYAIERYIPKHPWRFKQILRRFRDTSGPEQLSRQMLFLLKDPYWPAQDVMRAADFVKTERGY